MEFLRNQKNEHACVRSPRNIQFSGVDWSFKTSTGPAGPGNNIYSDSSQNVWVDNAGYLHMRIVQDGANKWNCSNIISELSFGFGTYRFRIGQIGTMNPNAVLGLITWSDDPAYNNREIDIEISQWSDPTNANAQFVVQPGDVPGTNKFRFNVDNGLINSTHEFCWQTNAIRFESRAAGTLLAQAAVTQGIPQPGGENVQINLWLHNALPPSDGQPVEMVIESFEFIPPTGP